jgi:hypothetical protein
MYDDGRPARKVPALSGLILAAAALALPGPGCEDDEGPALTPVVDAGPESGRPDAAAADTSGGTGAGSDGPAAPDVGEAPDAPGPVEVGAPADAAAPAEVGPPAAPPLYAFASVVIAPESETTYINLLDTLDLTAIDYGEAIERPGRGAIAAHGGALFVSEGEEPVITRFAVTSGRELEMTGRISFANFGFEAASLDEWNTTFVSPTKAYLLDYATGSHIIWNPTSLEITGEIEAPDLVRENLDLDGSTAVVRGNRMFRTFFWKDWKAYTTSREQVLATFDVENDRLISQTSETRCPGLNNRVEVDESGALYFSNWIYNVSETLVRNAPRSCALRILPGAEGFDPGWVLPFADLTEMREAAGLSYLRGGRGFLAVFHHERVTIDAMTDPQELALSANWRLWGVDLGQRTARPIEGIDWLIGGYSTVKLDGRTFVLVPGEDLAKTSVYEVSDDGRATLRFEARGFAYQLVKIR